MDNKKIFNEIESILNELTQIRRWFHQNPEISFNEFQTTKFIEDYLNSFGIATYRLLTTGTIAEIGSRKPKLLFRADIDALPIEEKTGLEFASKQEGMMHACGHDIHTTILLGTARLLKKHEEELPVTVKLVFQPGEEKLPGGAKLLIDKGLLDDPDIVAAYGQHTFPELEVGKIAVSAGTIMASADELYWELIGKPSHAAQPHQGCDPILASSHLTLALQSLTNKFIDPLHHSLLSITSINGGTATNIFPEVVKMMGTLRTFDHNEREYLLEKIRIFSSQISSLYGVECKFEPKPGYPPLENNPIAVSRVEQVAFQLIGENNVVQFSKKMWAEDFAYYSQQIPSAFWFLGVRPKDFCGDFPGLHNSHYSPSEESIKFGIAIFLSLALNFK